MRAQRVSVMSEFFLGCPGGLLPQNFFYANGAKLGYLGHIFFLSNLKKKIVTLYSRVPNKRGAPNKSGWVGNFQNSNKSG